MKALPYASMPFPLGLVTATAGNPVAITANYTDLGAELAHLISIQAAPSNTGSVWVLNNNLAADKVAYLNVLAVLAPGVTYFPSLSSQSRNMWQPSRFFIDVDLTAEGAFSTIVVE